MFANTRKTLAAGFCAVGMMLAGPTVACDNSMFENAHMFASLKGSNPAVPHMVGKITHWVQIQGNGPHKAVNIDADHPVASFDYV